MFVSPPNSHIEILTSKDDCVKRYLRLRVKSSIMGLVPLSKEISSILPPCEDRARGTVYVGEPLVDTTSVVDLILDFQNPELQEIISVVCKPPSLWCFVTEVQIDNK